MNDITLINILTEYCDNDIVINEKSLINSVVLCNTRYDMYYGGYKLNIGNDTILFKDIKFIRLWNERDKSNIALWTILYKHINNDAKIIGVFEIDKYHYSTIKAICDDYEKYL